MSSKSPTVREATLGVLRTFGVDRVFGNPGSTELAFLHDWPDDIDYVLGLQEACVVGMADGYAQATGRPAFVNLHSAAGLGHALGNLFTAFRNKTPLVVTAGQQARSLLRLRPYLFAEDAEQFPKPYVKWSVEPARAEDVPAAMAQAFLIAMQHPRGPTFVSVPSDDWSTPCDAPSGPAHCDGICTRSIRYRAAGLGDQGRAKACFRGRPGHRPHGLCRADGRSRRTGAGGRLGKPDVEPVQLSGTASAICGFPSGVS